MVSFKFQQERTNNRVRKRKKDNQQYYSKVADFHYMAGGAAIKRDTQHRDIFHYYMTHT